MPLQLDAPPVAPWQVFEPGFASGWKQGQHCLFAGPAGSGKTVCARVLSWRRNFVIVLGTKLRDDEMMAYIRDGYKRIDSWPPPRSALKPDDTGSVRLVLWPKIQNREQLRASRSIYARCMDDVLAQGNWTLVADEGLWLSDRAGLDLGAHLSALAYTGRSSGVTLLMLVQRPRGVPVNTWSNVSHAFLWHMGNTDDVREMASLGTVEPKAAKTAVTQLHGHQFLYLPTRAGGEWAISEVDLAVAA